MNTSENTPEERNEDSISIIQKLKNGILFGKDLDEETRLECVYTLRLQETSTAQIAQLLKMSSRNVRRDIKKLKERNALVVDKNFEKETLGDIEQKMLSNYSYFIRASMDKDIPPSERIQARKDAWNVCLDWAKLLQSVGHISQRQYSINAEVHHNVTNFTEKDILDIEVVSKQTLGTTPELEKILNDMRAAVTKPPQTEQKEKDNDKQSDQ